MQHVFPSEGEPLDTWFAPLHLVADAIAGQPRYRRFATDDFMVMSRVLRGPRPSVLLYEHRITRRYLNLDDTGRPYRFVLTRSGAETHGRYQPHRDLRAALDHLALW
jgi:hypothetical protein